jgi:pimeloyl-ACP methyl ester carboxylesterase
MKSGQKIGEYPPLHLDLKDVRNFYQRSKSQPENLPAPYDSFTGPFAGAMSQVDDPWNWPFEIDPNEEKKTVIFVHGWSMDYANYLKFSDTMFKRLWHQGFKGRFCSLRWDPLVVAEINDISVSNGEYNRSEHRAFLYGESLKQFANAIKGQGFSVSLIGHSMGNIVCGSALQKGLGVQNYVLMEAAVPAGCFDSSGGNGAGGVNGYQRFWNKEASKPTPDYHHDTTLGLTKGYRGFFDTIGNNVAGEVVNFHNFDDYALATGRKFGGMLEANWEKNEETYKPDDLAGHYAGYEYDAGSRAARVATNVWERAVTDSYEMKAFVARHRSKAVGAVDASFGNLPGGSIGENVNLRSYGFRDQDYDHSGQFNRRVQQLHQLYERILEIVK